MTTMRGNKNFDMARLIAQNPEKIALGGDRDGAASMNARGDILGKGGIVVVPREEVAREYHRSNPKAVKQVALRDIKQETMTFESPQAAMIKMRELAKKQRKIADGE